MANAQIQNHVGAPRLPDKDRTLEVRSQTGDQRPQVRGYRGEVVARVRFVRVAMTAQIYGNGQVPRLGKPPSDAVPQPGVGSKPVDQQEGRPGLGAIARWRLVVDDRLPAEDPQLNSAGHFGALVRISPFLHIDLLAPC